MGLIGFIFPCFCCNSFVTWWYKNCCTEVIRSRSTCSYFLGSTLCSISCPFLSQYNEGVVINLNNTSRPSITSGQSPLAKYAKHDSFVALIAHPKYKIIIQLDRLIGILPLAYYLYIDHSGWAVQTDSEIPAVCRGSLAARSQPYTSIPIDCFAVDNQLSLHAS